MDADKGSLIETSKTTGIDQSMTETYRTKTCHSPALIHMPQLVSIEKTTNIYKNYKIG